MRLLKELVEEVEHLVEEKNGEKFHYIKGVFMQSGIKNKNGRIYPRGIMENAVGKYVTEKINTGRAFGELCHPCFSETAKVLTTTGWKFIKDVVVGENVYTLNHKTKEIEIQPVLEIHKNYYDGDMIHLKNRTLDTLVTPYHKFPILDRNKELFFIDAKTIKSGIETKNSYLAHTQIIKHMPFNDDGIYLDSRFLEIDTVAWNDYVYCITTENATFLAMDNEYSFWSGNSGPNINLPLVSHIITELRQDGNNFIGKARIIKEGNGKIVEGILDAGGKLGVSSRGVGSLKESNGVLEVQDDFKIATAADIVADPSAPDALVDSIVENCEWVYDETLGWQTQELVESFKKEIKATKKLSEHRKIQIFESFFSTLAN